MNKYFINGKFLCQKITGVQRYAIEIVKRLDSLALHDAWFIVCPSKDYIISNLNLKNIKIIYTKGKPNYFWEQWILPRFCKKEKINDLLNLCNIAPILYPGSCTLHDLAFIEAPKGLNWKMRLIYKIITRLNIKRYNHVFTVSKTMAEHISLHYKIEKPIVTYNGYEHMLSITAKKPDIELPKDFYLAVGSMNPNKNFSAIIRLAENNPNENFVIAGGKFKTFKENNYTNLKNVMFLGYVSDENLVWLYANTKGFLFPSNYEGFGIPPLEALCVGCKKVICNNIPVLIELYDKVVNFVDFNDIKHINLETLKISFIKIEDTNYTWNKSVEIIYNAVRVK